MISFVSTLTWNFHGTDHVTMRISLNAFLLIMLTRFTCYAQSHSELVKLSKDSLVQLATAQVDVKTFHPETFNKISVWSIQNEVWVYFQNTVQFIPRSGMYYYEIHVNLSKKVWTGTPMGSGTRDPGRVDFFTPSDQQEKEINFVLERLKTIVTSKYLETRSQEGTIMISEKKNEYAVSISEGREFIINCTINKKTGVISDKKEISMRLDDAKTNKFRIY